MLRVSALGLTFAAILCAFGCVPEPTGRPVCGDVPECNDPSDFFVTRASAVRDD
jgi:hypothetical protein